MSDAPTLPSPASGGGETRAEADLLELAGVSKRFGRITVADSLSLRFSAGETVGIVGPNGAGKSTLFAMIAGDLNPDAGDVRVDGRSVLRLDPAARCRMGIARTYQVPRPFENMTVFENLLVAAYRGARLSRIQGYTVAARSLEETGLSRDANRPAGRLGLLQRQPPELGRQRRGQVDAAALDHRSAPADRRGHLARRPGNYRVAAARPGSRGDRARP